MQLSQAKVALALGNLHLLSVHMAMLFHVQRVIFSLLKVNIVTAFYCMENTITSSLDINNRYMVHAQFRPVYNIKYTIMCPVL